MIARKYKKIDVKRNSKCNDEKDESEIKTIGWQ